MPPMRRHTIAPQITPIRVLMLCCAVVSTICFMQFFYMHERGAATPLQAIEHNNKNPHQIISLQRSDEQKFAKLKGKLNSQITVVQGFESAYKFITSYKSQDPLYILLMSNKVSGKYWCPDCAAAEDAIQLSFAKAAKNSRLLEVRVGSKDEWKDSNNNFRTNDLFYVDYIPALLRYNGNRKTSFLLVENHCNNLDLLSLFFRLNPVMEEGMSLPKIVEYNQLEELVNSYNNDYPLFLFFISGTLNDSNGRLWCPFCDIAEIPVVYYFRKEAPKNARMYQVVVAATSEDWQDSNKNIFKNDKIFGLSQIPELLRITKDNKTHITLNKYTKHYDNVLELKRFYQEP